MKRLICGIALATTVFLMPAAAVAADETVHLQVLQAEKLIAQGAYPSAIALLDQYIAAHPSDSRALADRGDAYEAMADRRKAIADYTAAIALDPKFAYAYASRCQSRWELDEDRQALGDCNAALELKPALVYALRQRALVELDMKSVGDAVKDADKAVALAPGEPHVLTTRCQIYAAALRYTDAIGDCSAALAEGENEAARFYRGRAEIGAVQWSGAIADFSKVIEVDPSEPSPYYWRALARAKSGDYEEGLGDVDHYLQMESDDARAYLLRAKIQIGLGNRKEAESAANDALRHYRIDNDDAGASEAQALLDTLKQ